MDTVATILAVLLAVVMLGSATAKFSRLQPVVDNLDKAGVPASIYPLLGTIQVVGALGLIDGIWIRWAGVAAGIGFFVYFVLAVGFHVKAGDAKGSGVPVVLGLVALAEAVLRASA